MSTGGTPGRTPDLLRIRGLRIRAGRRLLVGPLDLRVGRNEAVAVVGPSGAGKSLTLAAVAGMGAAGMEAAGLTVEMESSSGPERPHTGVLRQDSASALDPLVRTGRQIGFPLRGVRAAERDRRVRAVSERLGLTPQLLQRHPLALSGGQRQRAALALALVHEPDLLVVDEPTSALDGVAGSEVRRALAVGAGAHATALLVATHDLDLVTTLCDRVVVMDAGRVVEEGVPGSVFTAPSHAVTRGLVRARRELGGRG